MSELSGLPGSEGYEVCDDEGQEPTWIERRQPNQNKNYERTDKLRESKFKNDDDLPLTLTAPEVGEVLGISRASACTIC